MSKPDLSRDEAINRLNERADALEARNAPTKVDYGHQASSQAYRILAELIGGVLVGIAVGFGVDKLFHTLPWGTIGGVLIGFGVSVWMAKRTADRLIALANTDGRVVEAVPFDDEDED
jgi:ATP synthase protein I